MSKKLHWVCAVSFLLGCSASGGGENVGAGAGDSGTPPVDASLDTFNPPIDAGEGGLTPEAGCATSISEAKGAPAALLIALDRSSSMAQNSKFAMASMAIVQAVDQDVFDTMSLGLYSAPNQSVSGPSCIFGLQVSCGAPEFPQIPITPAGTEKSTANSGVRREIKDFLTFIGTDSGMGDASPMWVALHQSIAALQAWPDVGKRLLLVVTDGTLSCNQLSNRPGFSDCNGCDHDWEHPDNIVELLAAANADPDKPVETFVVGVPGADTYDPNGCNFPPYHMRLALSAIAYAGSPQHVDPNCTGTTFSQAGGDPAVSCHFDMTQGNFSAQALADTISQIRGATLGCVYQLPEPTQGTVDKNRVNVEYSIGSGSMTQIPKRSDPSDPCDADGCWDYDTDDNVLLLGKTCNEVKSAPDAKVQIVVGCQTVVK